MSRIWYDSSVHNIRYGILEDAYATFARVETSVEELGQELEYHHERLGKRTEPEEKNI